MKRHTDPSRPFGQRLVDRFTAGFVYSGRSGRCTGRSPAQNGLKHAEHKPDIRQRGQRSGKASRLRQRNVWTC